MNDLLTTLFWENPYLPEKVAAFCATVPEYVRAEREYQQMADRVAQVLGKELYDAFEEKLSYFMAKEVNAYYLFGLGLRQEILDSMRSAI